MNLDQLIQQEKELMASLSENRNKQRELNKIAFTQKHGIDVGDTVEWTDRGILKRGVISEVEFFYKWSVKPIHRLSVDWM